MTAVPEPLAHFADLMSTYGPEWCLCGGWAVDSWLGRVTRDHQDIDITVFLEDQHAIFDHLAGWELIAHDPNVADNTADPWNGRALDLPAHIHARAPEAGRSLPDHLDAPSQQGFGLEIVLNERSGRDWILSGEPHIALPLRRCAEQSA